MFARYREGGNLLVSLFLAGSFSHSDNTQYKVPIVSDVF